MKVALLGGTGSFGTALARRLAEAGYEVVIGSRDAERARAAAAELAVEGATNADAARAADLVVLATKAEAALDTAAELREAIGTTPVLSVAAELAFTPIGVVPTPEATSIAVRLQEILDGPVVAGLHSLAARNLGADEAPDEDVLVCGDDRGGKGSRARARRADHRGTRDRLWAACQRASSRGSHRSDREREQALQGACRRSHHRRRLRRVRACGESPQGRVASRGPRDPARGIAGARRG